MRIAGFLSRLAGALPAYLRHAKIKIFLKAVIGLRFKGRIDAALSLFAKDLGISENEMREGAALRDRLGRRLSRLRDGDAIHYMHWLSTCLRLADESYLACRVFEDDAGIEREDYGEFRRLSEKLAARLQPLGEADRTLYIIAYCDMLDWSDSPDHEWAVIAAFLGLSDLHEGSRELSARLDIFLAGNVEPLHKFLILGHLASALASLGQQELATMVEAKLSEGVSLHHAFVGLDAVASVVDEARFKNMEAFALYSRGSFEEALATIESWASIEADDYRQPLVVIEKVGAACAGTTPETLVDFICLILLCLAATGQLKPCAELLKTALGITDGDHPVRNFSHAFAGPFRLPGTTVTWNSTVLVVLAELRESGLHQDAAVIVDAYLPGLYLQVAEGRLEGGAILCVMLEYWLEYWGESREKAPWDFCWIFMEKMRIVISDYGETLKDRESFLQAIEGTRRQILRVAMLWAKSEEDAKEKSTRRIEALCWDLELSQRLAVERLRLVQIAAEEGETVLPVQGYPWPQDSMSERVTGRYLPPPGPRPAGILGHSKTSDRHEPTGREGNILRDCFPQLAARLDEVTRAGVTEGDVIRLLGDDGLLLRASFGQDGSLFWMAVGTRRGKLEILESSAGTAGDLWRLRWAIARHDAAMGLVHWLTGNGRIHRFIGPEAVNSLVALTESASGGLTGSALDARREEIEARLAAKAGSEQVWARHWFRLATAPLIPGRDARWDRDSAFQLGSISDTLRQIQSEDGDWRWLDGITQRLLEEASDTWKLDRLLPWLTAETVLLYQVDDVLHGLPIAYLPVGGAPLFERARSVRISLAPLLDMALEALEDEIEAGRTAEPRLLCLSGVQEGDPALEGVKWLHWGHCELASKFHLTCLCGAEAPTGSVAALRGALQHHDWFAAATLCGHGDPERAGLALPLDDENALRTLWKGEGCDLSGVDLLILVSCSIGRAENTRQLDVEGFCVQLAAHRAKSILACRWPVDAIEAATFANEVLAQYLLLLEERRNPGSRSARGLRARAFGAARSEFAKPANGRDRPRVGLNTAAAFEMYGLG
ncbi:MAG TPA: CHAT domain-containing protein [Thermoanaerobaculia bacterium]|nr:CHAT domain-containing protein [Thermoanaerobaculia bacterium]